MLRFVRLNEIHGIALLLSYGQSVDVRLFVPFDRGALKPAPSVVP